MRKILFMAALVLIALPSMAGNKERNRFPYRYEFNVGWGYTPAMTIAELNSPVFNGSDGLDHIYGNYLGKRVTSGMMSAEFNIQFKKWFALGTQLNAVTVSNSEMSAITGQEIRRFTDYTVSALAYARFTYLHKKYVKLYSSIGAGLCFTHDSTISTDELFRMNYMQPSFQLVPVGVTVGKRIYGTVELGLGSEYMGFRAGVGYRF